MRDCKTRESLPFHVRRVIAGYSPHLREAIAKAVMEKMADTKVQGREITHDDISECVGQAVGEITSDGRNIDMERLSWDAYQRGEYTTLQDVIDELRSEVADTASA